MRCFRHQVPVLEETLRANTAEVLQEVAKHDMAEAIEHVVGGIGEVKDELQEAFLARDSGRTGALGGPAFKVTKYGVEHKKNTHTHADFNNNDNLGRTTDVRGNIGAIAGRFRGRWCWS